MPLLGIELGVIASRNVMGFQDAQGASLTGTLIGFATVDLTFILNIYGQNPSTSKISISSATGATRR